MPAAWVPDQGDRDTAAVFWPGFGAGDPWVVFRPATVRYDGAQGDGGLGFHGACVDVGLRVLRRLGEAREPGRDARVPGSLSGHRDRLALRAVFPACFFDQQASCNGHSLDLCSFAALRGDRVALVDTRTPVDTSRDLLASRRGDGTRSPASGITAWRSASTASTPTRPPADWLVRYAGDDGVFVAAGWPRPAHLRPARLVLVVQLGRHVDRGDRLPSTRRRPGRPDRGRPRS